MVVVERQVQHVRSGKWADLEAFDKKMSKIESRLGWPAKKRYRAFSGHTFDTLIVERQWESLAAMEAAEEKLFADPEWQALSPEGDAVLESLQLELYWPLP